MVKHKNKINDRIDVIGFTGPIGPTGYAGPVGMVGMTGPISSAKIQNKNSLDEEIVLPGGKDTSYYGKYLKYKEKFLSYYSS